MEYPSISVAVPNMISGFAADVAVDGTKPIEPVTHTIEKQWVPYHVEIFRSEDYTKAGAVYTARFLLGPSVEHVQIFVKDKDIYSMSDQKEVVHFLATQLAEATAAIFYWPLTIQHYFQKQIVEIGMKYANALPPSYFTIAGLAEEKDWGDTAALENPDSVAAASRRLPGMDTKVLPPCDCGKNHPRSVSLRALIMHLNDDEKWTREQIADWLDELHESGVVNLDMEPWEEDLTKEEE